MIDEEQKQQALVALVTNQHAQWLQSSITQGAKGLIDEEETRMVGLIASKAFDSEVSSEMVRYYAAQLNAIQHIKRLLFTPKAFITKTVKQ
jgi:hypothetical protein